MSLCRAERATAVLLADPCFQLRSIQYLLGHAEPLALAAAAPAMDKRHFSLQTCKCQLRAESWAVLTASHSWDGWGELGCWHLYPLRHVPAPLALGTGVHGSPIVLQWWHLGWGCV